MATLAVPGAELYYETWGGDGPLLLLIPGGNGDAASFAPLAPLLAAARTVVSYDRRGFSRSPLAGAPSDDERLGADAEDARSLIDHLGGGRADVLGSSSGAIVALELLSRRPEHVRTLVAHEPPLMTLLPDADEQLAFMETVYETYRRDGLPQAMALFAEGMGMPPARPPAGAGLPPQVREMLARSTVNMTFWLEHELLVYPRVTPDIAALRAHADKLVLAGGEQSRAENLPPYRPGLVLAERLGLTVAGFPGGHIGYVSDPDAFAARLASLLAGRPQRS